MAAKGFKPFTKGKVAAGKPKGDNKKDSPAKERMERRMGKKT